MTDAREIDGFCTDCGNWTDLHGPIGDRRCRCGSGRVAIPPTGFRILGPDEVDQMTLEKCAVIAEKLSETWSNSRDAYQAVQEAAASDKAHEIADTIRAIGRKA